MTEHAGMDAIRSEDESGICDTMFLQVVVHRRVDIDDIPTFRALFDQPGGVFIEHVIVSLVRRAVFGQAGRERLLFNGIGIKRRRGHVHELCAGRFNLRAQLEHSFAELRRTFLSVRIIDAVVHPVAGDDEVGLRLRQHAVEPLMQIGPGKTAARMAGLGKSGDRLARQTEIDELDLAVGEFRHGIRLDAFDVMTAVRDAVAEEDDAFDAGQESLLRVGEAE